MRRANSYAHAALLLICLIGSIVSCSPRDFLTRRLATDLISASETFKSPQLYWLHTGIESNKDYSSPESLVLQRRGWISGAQQKCQPGVDPPPCWDVQLTPLGVDVVRPLITSMLPNNGPIAIQVAHRELIGITGISKAGNLADVEFDWRWVSTNQVGAALYDGGMRYHSVVGFRGFDDGWRVVERADPANQPLDDALRNAKPTAP
jgi:hypothetical protein